MTKPTRYFVAEVTDANWWVVSQRLRSMGVKNWERFHLQGYVNDRLVVEEQDVDRVCTALGIPLPPLPDPPPPGPEL